MIVKSTSCVLILDHGLSPNKRGNHQVYPWGMQEFLAHSSSAESSKGDPVPKALLQFQQPAKGPIFVASPLPGQVSSALWGLPERGGCSAQLTGVLFPW